MTIYNKYNPYLLYMHWLTIYKKSDLPVQGWIQQCFMCYAPTAHTIEYHKDEYTHTVYLCKCCQKKNKIKENNKLYIQYVEQHIKEHTPQPFAVPPISLSPPKIVSQTPPLPPDLPRPHTSSIKSPYIPSLPKPPNKLPPIPITPPPPAPPPPPPPPSKPKHKCLYETIFESASKKLSSFMRDDNS